TSNLWFSIASVIFLTLVITFITQRVIEPRLGAYHGEKPEEESGRLAPQEMRGLLYALIALIGSLVFLGLLTLPSWGPLRDPGTGALVGDSPFMNGLMAVIMILFLVTGIAFGLGSGSMKGTGDIIKAIEKAISGLGGLIFLLLIISQFISYFNYSNMATLL